MNYLNSSSKHSAQVLVPHHHSSTVQMDNQANKVVEDRHLSNRNDVYHSKVLLDPLKMPEPILIRAINTCKTVTKLKSPDRIEHHQMRKTVNIKRMVHGEKDPFDFMMKFNRLMKQIKRKTKLVPCCNKMIRHIHQLDMSIKRVFRNIIQQVKVRMKSSNNRTKCIRNSTTQINHTEHPIMRPLNMSINKTMTKINTEPVEIYSQLMNTRIKMNTRDTINKAINPQNNCNNNHNNHNNRNNIAPECIRKVVQNQTTIPAHIKQLNNYQASPNQHRPTQIWGKNTKETETLQLADKGNSLCQNSQPRKSLRNRPYIDEHNFSHPQQISISSPSLFDSDISEDELSANQNHFN